MQPRPKGEGPAFSPPDLQRGVREASLQRELSSWWPLLCLILKHPVQLPSHSGKPCVGAASCRSPCPWLAHFAGTAAHERACSFIILSSIRNEACPLQKEILDSGHAPAPGDAIGGCRHASHAPLEASSMIADALRQQGTHRLSAGCHGLSATLPFGLLRRCTGCRRIARAGLICHSSVHTPKDGQPPLKIQVDVISPSPSNPCCNQMDTTKACAQFDVSVQH